VIPELDDDGRSDDFDGGGHDTLEPELPAESETDGGVDVTGGELNETASRRVVAHHLGDNAV
jgi:hypothetical protein